MINLETSKKTYAFSSIFSKFCTFGLVLATTMMQPASVYSHGQACVNSVVYQFSMINTNFDGTLNELHHMAFSASKSNNESFTYRQMLQEEDAQDFIQAMQTEIRAHESSNNAQSFASFFL